MKIAVFGTGTVGQTLATKLLTLGHEVAMGSRSATNEKAQAWLAKAGARARVGTYAEAAKGAALVVNATLGTGSVAALTAPGEGALDGKVILDCSNPLDFSKGGAPSLFISNTDSLAELLQRTVPKARVVKALNTMWCGLMVNPRLLPGSTTYVCGNDADAKATVTHLLESFGWRPDEILDLGDLTGARGTEAYLPLWLRIYGATRNGAFNLQVVAAKG